MKRRRARWRRVLWRMRLNIVAALLLAVLAVVGTWMLRTALLKNAQETGMAVSRNYAAEEHNDLAVYETLLSFGAASIDERVMEGASDEDISDFLALYFQRLETVLGEGAVDPYAVVDGKILAANPWDGDETYDVYGTEWYQKAMEADGRVVFTSVYVDAIYGKPVITAAQKCKGSGAVMAFDIFPENFRFHVDPLDISGGDSFFICDPAGTVIYKQTDLSGTPEELQAYCAGLIDQIEAGELERYDSSITDLDGNKRALYYTQMDNGWYSIVTTPYDSILGDLHRLYLVLGLILGGFLCFVLWMTWRNIRSDEQVERTNETVRVLGNSYYALYRIDFGEDTYEMIKGSDYVRERIPEHGPYGDLIDVVEDIMEPSAYAEFKKSFSRESIHELVSRRVRDFGGDFLRRFGDEYHWVSVRVLFDESLAPEEVVLCFREVDQEKQEQLRERELLENALDLARKNEQAKQVFFSSMSHDMRTPLNAIIGLSELAEQHVAEPEKMNDYLGKINASSRQLLSLINDILDMSRMEQGKLSLENRKLDLKECVEECLGTFQIQAEQEEKTFQVSLDIEDAWVLGDPVRISQILNNLLSNAFKFTSPGDTVSMRVERVASQKSLKYKFIVSDTGVGMSEEFLPRLFEPYARETRFSARKTVGTGLGMPITKNLVVQMNGEIYVESKLGKGSTFTMILPFEAAEGSAAPAEQPGQMPQQLLDGTRILLAEDNEVNMEITTELLTMNGAHVTQAWNGREAVEQFRDAIPFTFDAVLLDMQMPEMDGCEAAKKIRAMDRPDAKKVPIIAVTANAFAEDVAATAAAGMDAHVSKPIDFKMLCKTLGKLLRKES